MEHVILSPPVKEQPPDGWWSLPAIKGTRAGVVVEIQKSPLPDHAKAFILAEIAAVDAKFNFISLDAHSHLHESRRNLHLTLIPSTVCIS